MTDGTTMFRAFYFSVALLSLLSFNSSYVLADAEDCDSLDFDACFEENETDLKLFQPKQRQAPQKVYEQEQTNSSSTTPATQSAPITASAPVAADITSYEIRERYTLGKSAQTPYSAFFVIEALHKQMANKCPKGWTKLGEWSVAIEDADYYLHYEFACR